MTTRRTTIHTAVTAAFLLLSIGAFCGLTAAGGAIGMVTTNGNFQVDHSRVWGNTTLFDGSVIETARAVSQIQLNSGVHARLAADTRATIFQRKLVLEEGQGEMAPAQDYEVEVRSLRITAESADAMARVKVENDRRVLVAAVRGSLRVANAAGVVVAHMERGDALNFDPQAAGAMAATRATGCLLRKDGNFILADRTTNVILELQGSQLSTQVGNRVEISGRAEAAKPKVAGASQLVTVVDMKLVAKGGCSSKAAVAAAAGAGAGAAGAAGVSAGIGAGTVAVIGGVAAAATVGGLAAVGELPGQGDARAGSSR